MTARYTFGYKGIKDLFLNTDAHSIPERLEIRVGAGVHQGLLLCDLNLFVQKVVYESVYSRGEVVISLIPEQIKSGLLDSLNAFKLLTLDLYYDLSSRGSGIIKVWHEEVVLKISVSCPENQLCVVCLEKPKSIMFQDCKHVCLCETCLGKLEQQTRTTYKCPICRKVGQTCTVFL